MDHIFGGSASPTIGNNWRCHLLPLLVAVSNIPNVWHLSSYWMRYSLLTKFGVICVSHTSNIVYSTVVHRQSINHHNNILYCFTTYTLPPELLVLRYWEYESASTLHHTLLSYVQREQIIVIINRRSRSEPQRNPTGVYCFEHKQCMRMRSLLITELFGIHLLF